MGCDNPVEYDADTPRWREWERANRAEAKLREIKDLLDMWERLAGPESNAWEAFGPQVVSVPFALEQIRRILGEKE